MTCPLVRSVFIREPGLGTPEDRHPSQRRGCSSTSPFWRPQEEEGIGVGAAARGAQPCPRCPRRPPPGLGSERVWVLPHQRPLPMSLRAL